MPDLFKALIDDDFHADGGRIRVLAACRALPLSLLIKVLQVFAKEYGLTKYIFFNGAHILSQPSA